MAFQVGNIKIAGTIDELSFYNSAFGWLVRRKSGPTRKQFKNSPSFVRARENSNEFTLCSRAASVIRNLVVKHLGIKNRTLYHRLIKLMRLLANADQTSVRGQRDPLIGIHTTRGKLLLKDFRITNGMDLHDLLITLGFIKEMVRGKKATQLTKKRPVSTRERKMRPRVLRTPSTNMLQPRAPVSADLHSVP